MKTKPGMLVIVLIAVGSAALGSWRLSATANQAHDTGKNARVAISHALPRMDADHLDAKVSKSPISLERPARPTAIPAPSSHTWRKAPSAARSMTSRSMSTRLERLSMKPPMKFIEYPPTPARANPPS